uniref:Uncharacterized protein n=1 Tax=Gorilla gorilla gorilla TaxID=9595 RepID=A0A2I2ZJQ9_GORGO
MWRELRGYPGGDVERAQRLSRRRRGKSSEAVPEKTWRAQRLSQRRRGESSEAVPEKTWKERRAESSEAVPEKTWRELKGCPQEDVERVQRLSLLLHLAVFLWIIIAINFSNSGVKSQSSTYLPSGEFLYVVSSVSFVGTVVQGGVGRMKFFLSDFANIKSHLIKMLEKQIS